MCDKCDDFDKKDNIVINENLQQKDLSENDDFDDEFMQFDTGTFPIENKFGEMLFDANGNVPLSEDERKLMIQRLEGKFDEVMEILRISKNDPNSAITNKRIARMLVCELFSGRFIQPPKFTVFPNRKQVDELIISRGIDIMSVCSHHWQPISGECSIGYIPGRYIVGVSKLSRIVNWFARRGQIQEELGEQIADYIENLIQPKALGVVIKARHYCMIARGVRASENSSVMITSVMRGYLANDLNLRNEFLKLLD